MADNQNNSTKTTDIVFFCMFCGQKVAIPEAGAGYQVKCPSCNRGIHVPRKPGAGQGLPEGNGKASDTAAGERRGRVIRIPTGALNGSAPEPDAKAPTGAASDTAAGERRNRVIRVPTGAVNGSTPEPDAKAPAGAASDTSRGDPRNRVIRVPTGDLAARPAAATTASGAAPAGGHPGNHRLALAAAAWLCFLAGVVVQATWRGTVLPPLTLFATVLVLALFCLGRGAVISGTTLLMAGLFAIQHVLSPVVSRVLSNAASREAAPKYVVLDDRGNVQVVDEAAMRARRKAPVSATRDESRGTEPVGKDTSRRGPVMATPAREPQRPVERLVPREPAVRKAAADEGVGAALPGSLAEPPTEEEVLLAMAVPPAGAPAPAVVSAPPPEAPALPLAVYADCGGDQPFTSSGWMGYFDAISLDECWTDNPHSGDSCIRMAFNATYYWAGVAWQNPPNNWGEQAGGYNLTGASQLTFWARADESGTPAEFKVGVRSNGKFADSAIVSLGTKKLTRNWKQYTIPLEDRDLSRIISGFVCVVEGGDTPRVIYLDDIRYE